MSQPVDRHQSKNLQMIVGGETRETQKTPFREFAKNLSLIPFPNDGQERTSPVPTSEEWRVRLRERVSAIGQEDPEKASLLSRNILFYRGTTGEREALSVFGIHIPDSFRQEGLPGGMFEEAAGLVVPLLKGAVKLVVEGNKKEVEKQTKKQLVDAKVQLPNGNWIHGKHEGGRDAKKVKRFAIKRYSLAAFGNGKFLSEKVKYEGDFYDDQFHDLTGKAVYFIDRETRYKGCFFQGKRAQHGVLEKYNSETGEFYLYYRGTWKHDQPETGTYYSPQGKEIARIKEGVMQGMRHDRRPSQNFEEPVLGPSEEKDGDQRQRSKPSHPFNARSYPRKVGKIESRNHKDR